jgi:predicted ABC-type exoprotein transport system permease subunit
MIRPSFAPAISAFPVLAISAMSVPVLRNYKQTDSLYWLLLLCIVIALALLTISFRQREARNVTAIVISLTLVLTAFVVDRLFTNKVEIRSYSMNWSANGTAPWGAVERSEKGEIPVVIYRVVSKGYCFDALFSSELVAQLTATNKPVISVDYNLFKDFGRVRSYNVRAVDGMVFNDGFRPIRSEDAPSYGGYIEGSAYGNCH